jgi:glucose/arabinose dehydrogenase
MLKTKTPWKKLWVMTGVCLSLFLAFSMLTFLAQAETSCPAGEVPQFQLGFAQLKNRLGSEMGDPVECEHHDAQGNAYQQTTTGQAFFEKMSGDFSFTMVDQPLAIGSSQETTPTLEVTTAMAEMQNISGTVVGTAYFTETEEGLQVSLEISGFMEASPGAHGLHFHQVGRCTPDFALAGEHFNPTKAKHGLENPMGPHAGDLPNIEFDENGNATYSAVAMASLGTGEAPLLAADGTALMIHARADDQVSDPSGRSGSRIACGVLTAPDMPPPAAPGPPPPVQGNNIEPELRSPTPERIAQLQAPEGFEISVFGQGLGSVRMMAQAEDGTVYVTRRGQGDVLALHDEDGDGMADEPVVAASNLPSVHGIIIDGEQIYLATPTTITVGSLAADGTVGDLAPLVTNLPEGGQHGNRTMAFGPDGLLYVSVGSPCNACGFSNEEYAAILQVQPDGSSRTVFADGLRNTIGWGWRPETGQMWGMDHGSDWRGDDQPPEELNLLTQGNNYGWPYCFGDRQIDPYIASPPVGLTQAEFCAQSTAPVLTYQAHSAPIGMVFYTGDQFPEAFQNDAFVAMRGSWNRQEAVGYKIVHLDFDEAGQPVAFNDFVTGWLIEDGAAHFGRVAGLLVLQDGSLLISDDTNGMIYRVSYSGEQ